MNADRDFRHKYTDAFLRNVKQFVVDAGSASRAFTIAKVCLDCLSMRESVSPRATSFMNEFQALSHWAHRDSSIELGPYRDDMLGYYARKFGDQGDGSPPEQPPEQYETKRFYEACLLFANEFSSLEEFSLFLASCRNLFNLAGFLDPEHEEAGLYQTMYLVAYATHREHKSLLLWVEHIRKGHGRGEDSANLRPS
ncbi:MAG: hypothetical protein AAF670_15940 [Planctomycetota bacterium]